MTDRGMSIVNALIATAVACAAIAALNVDASGQSWVIPFVLPWSIGMVVARLMPIVPFRSSWMYETMSRLDDHGRALAWQLLYLVIIGGLGLVVTWHAIVERAAWHGVVAFPPGARTFAWALAALSAAQLKRVTWDKRIVVALTVVVGAALEAAARWRTA